MRLHRAKLQFSPNLAMKHASQLEYCGNITYFFINKLRNRNYHHLKIESPFAIAYKLCMENEKFSYEKQADTFYTQLNSSSRLTDAFLFPFPVNSFC